MLAHGKNREAFLQTRARWEAAAELVPATKASSERDDGRSSGASRTLPSRGRRARLRRSDSRDSLDDGRPSHDSPPRSSAAETKSKSRSSDKRRKSSTAEPASSAAGLKSSSTAELRGGSTSERRTSTATEPTESRRRSSRSERRESSGTVQRSAGAHSPDRTTANNLDSGGRQLAEAEGRGEHTGKKRLSRTPSLGARDKPALGTWSAGPAEEDVPGYGDAGRTGTECRPSQRAAQGIGADWGGSLNRRRMLRREVVGVGVGGGAVGGGGGGASGFQLPLVISGRLARQSESFVSSSPDLSRELFSPAEGRASPRVGRRDLDEILERAARRRSSRLAAGGTPLLSARALFVAEPRSGRGGRADSADRWERGSEGRLESEAGGRSWGRPRRDSDTSDASSAAAGGTGLISSRSSSSGVPEVEPRSDWAPGRASPLVVESPAARRAGFRRRAGSAGGILDELDPETASVGSAGGGWKNATRSWLNSKSAEAADDAAETSSTSSGADRRSATRSWLAQGRGAAEEAAEETASVGSGGGWRSSTRSWLSRGSATVEPAEEAAGRPPASPSARRDRRELASPALSSASSRRNDAPDARVSIRKGPTFVQGASDARVNDQAPSAERDAQKSSWVRQPAEKDSGHGTEENVAIGDRSTLLRQKLSALRTAARSERDEDKTQDSVGSEDRASQLRQKMSALQPDVDSEPFESEAPHIAENENRATLLRKKIASLTPKVDSGCDEGKPQDDTADENRATLLRQKMAALRPSTLNLAADNTENNTRSGDLGQTRSPLTPRSPRPARQPSPSADGPDPPAGVTTTPSDALSAGGTVSKPGADNGRPPADRSPAAGSRRPRPRSAVRRTASSAGRSPDRVSGGSPWRSRSRSPVKGRIATLRLKPRRVSQSPDPLARWRSVDDVLGSSSPATLTAGGIDASWEPQVGCVEPPPAGGDVRPVPPPAGGDVRPEPPPAGGDVVKPVPPPRPPRRRRSRPSDSGPPPTTKERVDENRNQISTESGPETSEESREGSSSPGPAASPPAEEQVFATGDDWLASLAATGRQRLSSESSSCSLGSFDLERQLQSAEEPVPAVPRQLTAVKSDLIAFSPGKEPAEPSPPPPAAAPAASDGTPTPPPAAQQTPAAADSNVAQQLKKQELYFQDQLLKRDREMTAMKNSMAKLKQQAANNQTGKVLDRVEGLVAQLVAEKEHLKNQLSSAVQRLTVERDEARQEVANAEAMFADLHRKYEKSKGVVQENRRCAETNESTCRESLEQVSREKQRYEMLQQYAEDTLARLRTDLEAAEKAHQTELLTLKAKLQLAENRETKLERENKEITAICDELIQKMGGAR